MIASHWISRLLLSWVCCQALLCSCGSHTKNATEQARSRKPDALRTFVFEQYKQAEHHCACESQVCRDRVVTEIQRISSTHAAAITDQVEQSNGPIPDDLKTQMLALADKMDECGVPRAAVRFPATPRLRAIAERRQAQYREKQAQRLAEFEREHVVTARTKCEAGDGHACFRLATILADSEEGSANDARVVQLEREACDKGSWQACDAVARRYQSGAGVEKDMNSAWAYSDRACRSGASRTCLEIADSVDARAPALAAEYRELAKEGAINAARAAGILGALQKIDDAPGTTTSTDAPKQEPAGPPATSGH